MTTSLSRDEILALPAVIDVETAARALGLGRTTAHALVRAGAFPVRVLRVGHKYRIPTAALLELLEVRHDSTTDDAPPAA